MSKTCLITGSAAGVGLAIAQYFFKEGFNIVITDINQEAIDAAVKSLDPTGERVIGVNMDVCDEAAVQNGFKKAAEKFSHVDVFVSNAGIQTIHSIEDFPLNEWEKLQKVHLTGAFLTTREAIRQMKPAGGGAIVYIGSIHSEEPSKNKAAYVSAKHGLKGLMRAVAEEGAESRIRSNMVSPAFVKTHLVELQIPKLAQQLNMSEADVVEKVMLKKTLTKEFVELEDIAKAVYFFATFPSMALTGQSLLLTHGWHMS